LGQPLAPAILRRVPEAHLRVVEQFFEDRAQRDLNWFLGLLDTDAELDFSESEAPYAAVYRGREPIESLFHQRMSGWHEVRYRTMDPVTGGQDVVIDCQRIARRHDGFGVEHPVRSVRFTLRDGRITYVKLFVHRADALRAAGLGE
jgi:ketosteroid isomerase-like protein